MDYSEQQPRIPDISLAGAHSEDAPPLPRGRLFKLRIWLEEKTAINASAMLRRTDEGAGRGVAFLAMSNEERSRRRAFVVASRGPSA